MLGWVLSELWADRLRTGLVALGVLWGTLGLAALLSFSGEMLRATRGTSMNFGEDLLRVSSASTTRPFRGSPGGRRVRLQVGDELAIAQLPGVRGAVIEHTSSGQNFLAGEARHTGTLVGTQPEFAQLRSREVLSGGRFLNLRDTDEARRVCYLGHRAARSLFERGPALGGTVEVRGLPFTVVGVGPERIQTSNYNGNEPDKVYIPDTTFRALTGVRYPTFVIIGLERAGEAAVVEGRIRAHLAMARGFDPADLAALDVHNYVEMQDTIETILGGNRMLTAAVGILGFLVAALGVANATWARVEEQRREIGLSMALGARRAQVMLPPLMEASLVAFGGGAIGLALAAGVFAVGARLDIPLEARAYLGTPLVSLGLGAAIVVLLVIAGAIAGWVPARRAAKLDPVVVLREE